MSAQAYPTYVIRQSIQQIAIDCADFERRQRLEILVQGNTQNASYKFYLI